VCLSPPLPNGIWHGQTPLDVRCSVCVRLIAVAAATT